MKLSRWLRIVGTLCFLLLWIPFAMIMLTGPLASTLSSAESASNSFFWTMTPWIALTIGLGVLAAVSFIAAGIVGSMSNILIEAKGVEADAEILSIRDTGTRINDDPVVDFSLRVSPPNQPAFEGKARRTISIVLLPSYQPGKAVKVKYIPGKEQVSILGDR